MQRRKGSDVGSFDAQHSTFVSLFHPRRQRWEDNFALRGAIIEPRTPEGRATARLLKFNLDKRVVERQLLAAIGRFLVRKAGRVGALPSNRKIRRLGCYYRSATSIIR
jgi:hypothetical protein